MLYIYNNYMESKKSVLIIEDERMISDAIKEKLSEDAHINIITARDGRDGLDKVIAEKPDLVLLDLIMPVMNGVDLLKTMRSTEEGMRTKVIIISNLDKENIVQTNFDDLDISEYIVKADLDIDVLLEKVQSHLGV